MRERRRAAAPVPCSGGQANQQTLWELDGRASELERERDEARDAASASGRAYEGLEDVYQKERAAHGRTSRLAFRLSLAVTALLVVVGLLTWRPFA